jgi:hypothetical protein
MTASDLLVLQCLTSSETKSGANIDGLLVLYIEWRVVRTHRAV